MVLWERKFGSKAPMQPKSACLRCIEVGNSPSHSDSTVPSQALWCVAISLKWTIRDTMAVHNNTHFPALNPVIFPMETRKPGKEGRKGKRGQTVTHQGCILTSKQDMIAVHIWVSELESSHRPRRSDAPLYLKGCEHETALWVAIMPKQLTVGDTPHFPLA